MELSNLHPQYLTNSHGERTSVLLPISEFSELLEDIEDLAKVAERKDEPTTSHSNLIEELKLDGF